MWIDADDRDSNNIGLQMDRDQDDHSRVMHQFGPRQQQQQQQEKLAINFKPLSRNFRPF